MGIGLLLGLSPGVVAADATQPFGLTNPLVPANECDYCHSFNNAPVDAADPLYSPVFTWRGSMMANSAVDPVFWAGVAIASQDADAPEETEACIRCHSPRAFVEGRGAAISIDELEVHDRAGVECEVCHRMVADEVPGEGHYTFDDVLLGDNVPRRGPWAYPDEGEIPAPPHDVVVDPFTASSELCGTCHDVTTPRERVDERGVGLGVGFNEQRTYSEWAGSAYASEGPEFRSCQGCHMPEVSDAPGCRDNVNVHSHPEGARRHDLLGANRFVIELLAAEAGVFDAVAFNHSLSQLDEFVLTAATLDVMVPDGVHLGEGIDDLGVTVTNNTGHKLPTGYSEGRIMWIEVVARMNGMPLWSSGRWDDRTQAIIEEPQLRSYGGNAIEYASGQRFHLLRNDYWEQDTRIPPLGLVPNLETDPVTDRYPLQGDGTWANYDEVHYVFEGQPQLDDSTPEDSTDDVLDVSVRLLYVINTRSYVEFLADNNVTNEVGSDLVSRFQFAGGATPIVLAEELVSIPILSFGEPTGTTGLDGTTTDDGLSTSEGGTSLPGGTAGSESTGEETAANDEGRSGCSCRSHRGPRGLGPWVLFLGVLAIGRRRRGALR